MKRALAFGGSALALLCAAFFLHGVAMHWQQIREIPLDARTSVAFAVAVLAYAATYLAGARSWQLELRMLQISLRYRTALRILATSQFAKYLPGNVAHHVGRVVLAQRAGVPPEAAVTSLALDTALVAFAGIACAFGASGLLQVALARYGGTLVRNAVLAAAVALGLVLLLLVRPVRIRLQPIGLALLRAFRLRQLHLVGEAFVQFVCNFVLGAAALGAVLSGLAGIQNVPWGSLLGVYAIAWLAGFFVPGAPAGIGIRESLLMLGLTPAVGADVAVAGTALFRLATVLGDGLVFASALRPTQSTELRSGSDND